MHVDGREATPRLQIREDGRTRGDGIEVINRERYVCLSCNRQQVEHCIRGPGRGCHGRNGILQRVARDEGSRADVLLDQPQDGSSSGACDVIDPRGDMPRKAIAVAIVFAVN